MRPSFEIPLFVIRPSNAMLLKQMAGLLPDGRQTGSYPRANHDRA
jgi:hypothetical protein